MWLFCLHAQLHLITPIIMAMGVCREILESQQGEMDFLVSQQRDTKRDSRLVSGVGGGGGLTLFMMDSFSFSVRVKAFIYDLEKVILHRSSVM